MSRYTEARLRLFTGNRAWRLLLATLLLPLLIACGSSEEAPSTAAVQITLLPGQSANELQVQLRNPTQAPITDATVALEGNMNHAGMVPILTDPVRDDADGATDGLYRLPFQFSMLGDWIVSVTATLADGTEATKDIEVTVTDGGVQIHDEAAGAASSAPMAEGMMVHDVMASASPLAGGNGAVYFMVMNNTAQADRLIAVESDVAAATELHESVEENNVWSRGPMVLKFRPVAASPWRPVANMSCWSTSMRRWSKAKVLPSPCAFNTPPPSASPYPSSPPAARRAVNISMAGKP